MKKNILVLSSILFGIFSNAQTWNVTGNSGTNPASNFVGTSDKQPLILKSNNIEGLRVNPNGDVVISRNDNPAFTVQNSNGFLQIARSNCNGCYGVQNGDTMIRNLATNSNGTHNIVFQMPNDANDGTSYIGIQDESNGIWAKFFNNATARFNGKIFAKEVEVKANVWADYVFNKDYQLLKLEEVEKHISKNGHLPNVPSSKEVMEKGINVAEMDAKLLEKIEELTLYSIEQNKQLKSQSKEIDALKKQVQQLISIQK
jgi:hypothetical protein